LLIKVNGESRDVLASLTIGELIHHLALAPERLAIELNQRVVRRADWQQIVLKEGDRVEIVHFVGGGMKAVTSDK
jgi:thiamine biosynthesis protein ThiS